MVTEEDEDLAVSGRLQYFAVAASCLFTRHCSEEVLGGDVLATVVNSSLVVYVFAVWCIEDLPWDRVRDIVRNVVIGKQDHVFRGNTVLGYDFVGVVCVGLVAVIPEAV